MSASIQVAQSKWLAQLASMRAAVEELKLDQSNINQYSSENDTLIDDDDLSGSDGIWDVFGEDETDEYSSDMLDEQDGVYLNGDSKNRDYGVDWIRTSLTAFANHRSELDVNELQEQISTLLNSDMKGMFIITCIYQQFCAHFLFR